MIGLPLLLRFPLLQRSAAFAADAPLGTGLEWMTVGALLLPALLIVLLVYLGESNTV
ncbi:hypothetical protein [Salinibacter sp. 10B]|uniref:hypothetical protein n=1 Tax=Salinibacter sp. 10B TaxID=1923971 RepID=UPI0015E3112B|nr:hypothetical protein [Salinibacter sp. 10B]